MGDDSDHHPCTRAGQGGGSRRGDLARQISRPTAAECTRIGPANAEATATVGRRFSSFSGHSRPTHTSPPPLLDTLNSFRGPFSQIPHRLKDTMKISLADSLIEFSGHYSNFWTKVRLLLCSWSLGIFVDIKFVNFGCRLVSFPFLGHLG